MRLSKPRSHFSLFVTFSMNFNVVPKLQHRTCLSKSGCTHTCTLALANTHGPAVTLNVWHKKIYYHLSVLLSAASFLYLSSPNPEWDQRRSEKHPEPNRPGHCEPVHHHASQPRNQTTAERWGKRKHPLFTFTFSSAVLSENPNTSLVCVRPAVICRSNIKNSSVLFPQ